MNELQELKRIADTTKNEILKGTLLLVIGAFEAGEEVELASILYVYGKQLLKEIDEWIIEYKSKLN